MLSHRIRTFTQLLNVEPPALPTEANRVRAATSVRGLRRLAKRRTPGFVFDYVDGAAGSERAARANLASFARQSLTPSVTESVAAASLATTLFGQPIAMPVGVAPIGLTSLMRGSAESAGARAAARRGIPFTLSTMGTRSLEQLAIDAPRGRRWFQLYLRRDRAASLALVERAAEAGYEALVVTLDTRVPGLRLRDERNQLTMPPRLTARTALQSAVHPAWTLDLLRRDAPTMANFGPQAGGVTDVVAEMFDPALSIDDLAWLREHWSGPLIVKGVLAPTDATRLLDAGADGIWVSNHGGRQLDRAVSPLDVVPAIREAVGNEVPVLLDSGVRTGVDVVTAIAAGADAVFLGRAYLYGLMAGGQLGAERVFDLIEREALNTLQLLGLSSIAELRANGRAVLGACHLAN